ncbi:sushi domain-containing protein 4-like isoform X4 [Hippocampus zosterae]|uniref:sushi domain-containing protein 4-like isoform X4 n=1 Tax=Hippocampus zosterae TaxID=109293 RepID=UPI00223DB80A|nr:sushi domain-containing protein 4-like isoform X4 [Hippocampus zosterae]
MCNGKSKATSQACRTNPCFKWSLCLLLALAVVTTGQDGSGCVRPVMVEHGSATVPKTNMDDFPVGTVLEYHCDSGYLLDGPGILTCTALGHWSSEPPQCIHSDECQSLHLPKNGGYTCHPSPCRQLSHGTVIEFSCDEGYTLKGDYKYLTCQYGEWDGPVQISCVKEQGCVRPYVVENSWVNHTETNRGLFPVGTVLQYSCDPGYLPDGPNILTCISPGRWSSQPPNCTQSGACLRLSEPENGGYTCHPSPCRLFSHGTVIEFFCHPGFVLMGDYYLTCQDGQWDGPARIKCVKQVCRPPYQPQNGGYTCHPYPCGRLSHGTVIEYFCDEGYIMKGEYKYLTCQYGTWDGFMQISCVMKQEHNTSLSLGMPTWSIISSTASSVALILLLVVLFVLLQPKLKSFHRRERDVSGHPVSIAVEGIQVTLPSYEEAVSNNSASASDPSSESRVQIVLSEGYPQTTGPEAGPSQPSSLSQLHSEIAVMDPSPPSSFSSPSSGTLQHAGTVALPHDDQRGLPLFDSEVDCSDDMPLLKEA